MRQLMKHLVLPLVILVVIALSSRLSWSQNVYGTIAGTVRDPSGAAISNATVTLTTSRPRLSAPWNRPGPENMHS